ncbi:DUF1127 domain-containing protein [Dongia deserti]|uniref:DUF1127 domain-containing protein n=1 Tax=Dongia deserti TaxID=2268030 RepID=UPI000E65A821|nr:DUF1127 domain-containing protein [Dongia deserti]
MKSNVFSSPINGLSRGVGHEIVAVLDRLLETPFVWAERAAERRHLSELDDHLLNDIGLNRADVEAISTKPFWRP